MVDVAQLHRRAVEQFDIRVARIGPAQWTAPTPCADWEVRELVNHIVGENLWTPPLMSGQTIAEVGDRLDGDILGEDPAAAWRLASEPAVAAVSAPGALDRTTHLSFGDVPGSEYAMQLFTDHLVHAWDLARAVGADERLPEDLVDACTDWFGDREGLYRQAGLIGPAVAAPAGADAQTALLARFGRG